MKKITGKIQLNQYYPDISERLIKCLKRDFQDKLPRKFLDAYELGVLVGQQQVIDKLILEKRFRDKEG